MVTRAIADSLTHNHIISAAHQDLLVAADSEAIFMERLTSIFESKVNCFVSACYPLFKKHVVSTGCPQGDVEAKTIEKIFECMLSSFLDRTQFSILPFMKHALQNSHRDLLVSAGLECINASVPEDPPLAKQGLVKFVARQRIFHLVNFDDLRALCEGIRETHPMLFPVELLEGLEQERRLSAYVRHVISASSEHTQEAAVANACEMFAAHLHQATFNHLFYLSRVLQTIAMSDDVRERYFYHTIDLQRAALFSNGMAREFVVMMQNAALCQQVFARNLAAIQQPHFKKCEAALRILGFETEIDVSSLDRELRRIDADIGSIRKMCDEVDRATQAAIDQTRANLEGYKEQLKRQRAPIYFSFSVPFK
jgi:hypothetical protein